MKKPNSAAANEIPDDSDDPIADYVRSQDAATQEIAACFKSVSKRLGAEVARQLFDAVLPLRTVRKGRRPVLPTVEDINFMSAVFNVPHGQKLKTTDEFHKNSETARKRLQRLRKAWKALAPIDKHFLIEAWVLALQTSDGPTIAESFGGLRAEKRTRKRSH
jgi:hypothetical protein